MGVSSNFIKFRGEKIAYWIYGEEKTSNPLLIVHGGPGASHKYLLPLTKLATSRPVIFYDQLGSGQSSVIKNTTDWCLEYFLSELLALVDCLNLGQFHLFGHSWGSILAVEYALRRESTLKSLILASPCLSVPCWIADTKELKENLPIEVLKILNKCEIDTEEYQLAAFEYYKRYVYRLPGAEQKLMELMQDSNETIYKTIWGETEFLVTGNIRNYDITSRLSEITVPTLFTCGQYDEATPKTTENYQKLMRNASSIIFENSSHLAHVEEKEKYWREIESFIGKS
jgi:proline iminopeptidase